MTKFDEIIAEDNRESMETQESPLNKAFIME